MRVFVSRACCFLILPRVKAGRGRRLVLSGKVQKYYRIKTVVFISHIFLSVSHDSSGSISPFPLALQYFVFFIYGNCLTEIEQVVKMLTRGMVCRPDSELKG